MLNFRKLKKDYSSSIIAQGKELYDDDMVVSARIVSLTPKIVRLNCRVMGKFDNTYECEIEVDRHESVTIDSNCDCAYKYDCQHLAAVIFYLEVYLDKLVVVYSKEADIEKSEKLDKKAKATLRVTFKEAATKEVQRKGEKRGKELLEEYVGASRVLGKSPFFHSEEVLIQDQAELAVLVNCPEDPIQEMPPFAEIQLALRLPFRSKPLNVPNIKEFLEAIRYSEPIYISGKRYYLTLDSFDSESTEILKMVMDFAKIPEDKEEHNQRIALIDFDDFGMLLAHAYDLAKSHNNKMVMASDDEADRQPLPCLYCESLEEPLRFSPFAAILRVELEFLETPAPKILLNPAIVLDGQTTTRLEEVHLFECATSGMIHQKTYYRFQPHIKRKHLRNLSVIRDITIPEPLFGTFVENSLPELLRYAEVANQEIIENFVTLPYTGEIKAECDIHYLNGELEASIHFIYDKIKVPASSSHLDVDNINAFVTRQGILARDLAEEQRIIEDLFQDFVVDPSQGVYSTKSDKKVVEFMTEVIPRNQFRVTFNCPENLLDQFVYDDTHFKLSLRETDCIDMYEIDLKVDGDLSGLTIDLLWECLASKRAYVELVKRTKGSEEATKLHKILVLNLEKLAPVVQIFNEIGINKLDNHKEKRPLWSLASIDPSDFKGLPIEFNMTSKLKQIQQQMLGKKAIAVTKVPPEIKAKLRKYQVEGVNWLDRLRNMHLSGILADDMGLGKTLQAIIAIAQYKKVHPKSVSIVICPTSLVYNWKEEFTKFHPKLKVLPVDGTPVQRKKLLEKIMQVDVVITSYSLLQKDIDQHKDVPFGYAILDEAQHIKNRGTRNAKSVKMLQAAHKLILTGTPIENYLEELWSLFDFLMPGLLSSYDRFVEKFIRNPNKSDGKNIKGLRRKLMPFILRRMKKDVLSELPPVTEIDYHCHLTETQQELYKSYSQSACDELTRLVKKKGFDKVQIHVLATLTRLKQICCHPAIFAKEKAEIGDSAKYDMLMELLQTLIEGKHRTVIFSQYTRMLQIIRHDLEQQGIRFEYLDGSTKNRLSIVKKFNEDDNIPIFLVSLKAGGSGLNLVGADTVIHYDMWWNPAVENQATDRVHRIGQKNTVSAYKLITKGTIEEKIVELQNRKKNLVKNVINTDEEAISKLTWEEVLELLQT